VGFGNGTFALPALGRGGETAAVASSSAEKRGRPDPSGTLGGGEGKSSYPSQQKREAKVEGCPFGELERRRGTLGSWGKKRVTED